MVFGLIKELRIKQIARKFKPKNFLNIAVLGAAGGIGQPLSLLIRESPFCNELRLYSLPYQSNRYDVNRVEGIATDLSHCNVEGEVYAFNSANLLPCLKGADIVVIPAGKPRSPGMTRDQLFETNAKIVADLVSACGQVCPKAKILIITNPINSVVPLAAEVLKKVGVYDPRRLIGITKLDGIRSITFLSELINKPPKSMIVPVIGGHAGETIIPLWSKTHRPLQFGVKPPGFNYKSFTQEQLDILTHDVQYGGDAVVQAKHGTGSATLAMSYAGGMFVEKLAKAMNGEPNIYDCAYVNTTQEATPFFATRCKITQDGVEPYHITDLAPREAEMVQKMLPTLKKQIDKGIEFGKNYEIVQLK